MSRRTRLIRRVLTRPSRIPAMLRLLAAAALGALAIAGLAAPGAPGASGAPPGSNPAVGSNPAAPDTPPASPGPGNPTKTFPTSPTLLAEGYNLYENACSSCHGVALQGRRGSRRR